MRASYSLEEPPIAALEIIRSLQRSQTSKVLLPNAPAGNWGQRVREADKVSAGGNSNLGGPVWIPADYLLVETMRSFHHFYADGHKIKCPTGSRIMSTLNEVADDVHHAGGKLDNAPPHA